MICRTISHPQQLAKQLIKGWMNGTIIGIDNFGEKKYDRIIAQNMYALKLLNGGRSHCNTRAITGKSFLWVRTLMVHQTLWRVIID